MKVKDVAFDGDDIVLTVESALAEDNNQEYESRVPMPPNVIVSGATVFGPASSPTSWTDLDLSGTVGSRSVLAILQITAAGNMEATAVRKNGDSTEYYDDGAKEAAYGCALASHDSSAALVLICVTDAAGVIEWITEASQTATIKLIAYIK